MEDTWVNGSIKTNEWLSLIELDQIERSIMEKGDEVRRNERGWENEHLISPENTAEVEVVEAARSY